jgi:RsiW-degrading membrane proteinase PrsW (M82 family)
MSREDDDPVKAAFDGDEDLYDVATWEVRSALDGAAVAVWEGVQRAGRWAVVLLAVALFAAELTFIGLLIYSRPLLGVLAALSVLPALLLAGYFWIGDPTMREPVPTLAITFVLAVVLAGVAAVVNTVSFGVAAELATSDVAAAAGPLVLFFLVVGPIEEVVKVLAVRLYAFPRDEFDTVVDGVVYGAVAGLGFATIENVVYISQGYLLADAGGAGPVTDAVRVASSRAFVGPGHVIYSAWAGYYLGLARFNPERRGPIVVKGLLVAAFIHATYNSAVTYLPLGGLGFVAFVVVYDGVLIGALYTKLARYQGFYHRARGEAVPGDGDEASH